MANYCKWIPSKGTKQFNRLKESTDYDTAWKVIGVAQNQDFLTKYGESLSFDAEGFPTLESLLNNSYIQDRVLGIPKTAKILSKNYPTMDNTLENYGVLLRQALKYNQENKDGKFIAVVDYADGGIKMVLKENNSTNKAKFKDQYGVYHINEVINSQLGAIGITPELLSKAEERAGRVGVTKFVTALGMAKDAIALIKIANNMEGAFALSEEFSHLLIDALADNPLVSRSLRLLSSDNNALQEALGEEFDDVMEFYDGDTDMAAEEALGKILRGKLLENSVITDEQGNVVPQEKPVVPEKAQTLIQRLVNYIKNLFKKVNYKDMVDSVGKVEAMMDSLSKDVLSNRVTIQKEKINARNRNVEFNALSDRIERNIKMLKEAINTETKRSIILKEDSKIGKKRIEEIEKFANDKADTALGIMTYAYNGLKMMQSSFNTLNSLDLLDQKAQIQALRTTKTILQSYGSFIDMFNDLLLEEGELDDDMFKDTFKIKVTGGEIELDARELLKDIRGLIGNIASQYNRTALPIFVKFLEDSIGKEAVQLLLKNAGDAKSIEDILTGTTTDISWSDLWLDAMRDSANSILQAYDKTVKNANDRARMSAIELFQKVTALRQELESLGMKDFDWMFEVDAEGNKSGNYVNLNYNVAEFNRQRAEMEKRLIDTYGENPKDKASRDAKKEARKVWLKENSTLDDEMNRIPKADKFPPTRLTSEQKTALSKILALKKEMDDKYPESRVSLNKAIQVRKDGIQRLTDSGYNPVKIYQNWVEDLKSNYLDRSDDDGQFGTTTGLTNFDGTEFMRLPMLYTNRLQDPNELSTDIFGALYAYAASSTKYEELEKIVAPLELGRDLIKQNMEVQESRGQKKVEEVINHLGQKIKRPVTMASEPNIFRKLDIFMETQVYQRYLKDEGSFNLFGAQVKTSKVTSKLLQMGSVAQLGFNWLANLANATTGVAMTNIEAAAGQFFKAKDLLAADAEYTKLIVPYTAEFYARHKTSKLALFQQLFDVRQDFGNNKHHTERSNLLRRIFGRNIQFIGQEAGDNWLYNRVAIATCKNIKVKYKGETKSLWDVLDTRKVKIDGKETDVMEMYVPDGVTDLNGNAIDKAKIGQISRRIAAVNQRLFGIYNEDDMNAANRVSLGRILQQYRKWMKVQFNTRFEGQRTDLDLGMEVEGYYRTTWRLGTELIRELRRGQFQYTIWKNNLTDMEKANLRRSIFELAQFIAISALVMFLTGGDADRDKDKPYALRVARYAAARLLHETGNLAPSYTMIEEMLKTVQSPAAVLGVAQDCSRFVGAVLTPSRWNDELQSGDYKGHSHLYKYTSKLPIPVLAHARQFKRAVDGLDKGFEYYTNPDVK